VTPLVLDASAVLAIVLDTVAGNRLLAHTTGCRTFAPELLATEVANGLWKYVVRGDLTIEIGQDRLQEGVSLIDTWWPNLDLAPDALSIAAHARHPVYDTTYLALAKRVGAKALMTLDRRLGRLAKSAGLEVLP
jgi:predicted nucleic acid-binding protein